MSWYVVGMVLVAAQQVVCQKGPWTTNPDCPGESICLGEACMEACGDWEKCKGKAICLRGGRCYCRVGYAWNINKGCTKAECNRNEDCQRSMRCESQTCKNPCVNSCGVNTFCEVNNHEPTCHCQPGYSGDPSKGCTYECGITNSQTTLIHQGSQSLQGDFPWLVALYNSSTPSKWEQHCEGTLISPRVVLTAARCLKKNGRIIPKRNIKVGLGKYYRSFNRAEDNSIISDVEDIFVPADYTGASGQELDIGLIRLIKDAHLSDYVRPACTVWSSNVTVTTGDPGYIAGWGTTERGVTSDTVLNVQLSYLDYVSCKKKLNSAYKIFLPHDKFCTSKINESHADNEDTGGGFMVVRNNRHYIVGIVSTKLISQMLVDESTLLLSTFTDLTNPQHRNWIKRHMTF